MAISVVPIGRRMNGREKFMWRSAPDVRAAAAAARRRRAESAARRSRSM